MAAELHELCGGATSGECVARLVQQRAATQALSYLSPHEYQAKEKPTASDPPNQRLRAA